MTGINKHKWGVLLYKIQLLLELLEFHIQVTGQPLLLNPYMKFIPTPGFPKQWWLFKLCFWTCFNYAFWLCNDLWTSNVRLMTWCLCNVLFWLCNDLWTSNVWVMMVFLTIKVYVFFTFYFVQQIYAPKITLIYVVIIQGLIWWYF